MKATAVARLRLAFAILAWLAQALMPVAHAAAMEASLAAHGLACGDSAAALAVLPAELRAALDDGSVNVDRLASCTLLYALGATLPPPYTFRPPSPCAPQGLGPAPADHGRPSSRPQSPTPPAHAPPAHA